MQDHWWVDLWEELCLDALERLRVPFPSLPIRLALVWGKSVALIEGTHTNTRLKLIVKKEDDKEEVIPGAFFGSMGGGVTYTETKGPMGNHWERLRREYVNN